MSTASLIRQPDLEVFAQRAWEAAHNLHAHRGLSVFDQDDVVIVVSRDTYSRLRAERAAMHSAGWRANQILTQEFVAVSNEVTKSRTTFMGIPVEPSRDLEDHEIRFRMEVPA